MSIEAAMVARARPQIMARTIAAMATAEAGKGCSPDLADVPVRLEPPYMALGQLGPGRPSENPPAFVPDDDPGGFIRLRVWTAPEQKPDWSHAELFLKQMYGLGHRAGFEIVGNEDEISTSILCQPCDVPVVVTAFEAQFEHCEVTLCAADPLQQALSSPEFQLRFRDFLPPPPYSHLLTNLTELKTTPFASLLIALGRIRSPCLGFYQCLFEPVDPGHDWHRNVQALLDFEYIAKLNSGSNLMRSYLQQAPSGDLRGMAENVETKAHSDKPFFACAVRVGVLGEQDTEAVGHLNAASTCLSLFQHGGKRMEAVSGDAYFNRYPESTVRRMLTDAVSYRPGFLLNSRELVGLAHVFPVEKSGLRDLPLRPLEPLARINSELQRGTQIGNAEYAGRVFPVCIPELVRYRGTHILASTGMGKTVAMIRMVLQDIVAGKGIAFIDPHGDAVRDILRLIPEALHDRCIYFDPGNPEWTPLWNPLHLSPGVDRHRLADSMIAAFRHVCRDWGDRLGHVIRNGLVGLLYTDDPCLYDLYMLTRRDSQEGQAVRDRILAVVQDEAVKLFWERDFKHDYRASELASPKHKLSQLVSAGPVSSMFKQRESRIDLPTIMDTGMILLVDLSKIGPDIRDTLGGLILNSLLDATLSRTNQARDQRRPFSVYADEAHLFLAADAIEGLVTQARKFRVSFCLAHQYLRQFTASRVDGLSTVGTTMAGRIDKHDAQYLAKDLQGLVDPAKLTALDPYEMIARIGGDVVRFKTLDQPAPGPEELADRIVERSHQLYYRRASELNGPGWTRSGDQGVPGARIAGPQADEWHFADDELAYEEF
ncbi:MAG: ATP-binding protein [Lentisphaerae bacterium]|nr:ATP-binding protein [Lentisphaerota bacterium]MBT5606009.1 ATP-binding protein [Lentisphaerota bacterium]MBT7058602.1 ATP-binding protein [Lentisphaerota bacterium]MBT7845448.1 ATP-binding protein [Lentisphaerota bacterium]